MRIKDLYMLILEELHADKNSSEKQDLVKAVEADLAAAKNANQDLMTAVQEFKNKLQETAYGAAAVQDSVTRQQERVQKTREILKQIACGNEKLLQGKYEEAMQEYSQVNLANTYITIGTVRQLIQGTIRKMNKPQSDQALKYLQSILQ